MTIKLNTLEMWTGQIGYEVQIYYDPATEVERADIELDRMERDGYEYMDTYEDLDNDCMVHYMAKIV